MQLLFVDSEHVITIYPLKVDVGRIPRHERFCAHCNKCEIGDEFHYILSCNSLQQERSQCLSNIKIKNAISFKFIMSSTKHCSLRKLCAFIRKINKKCSPG